MLNVMVQQMKILLEVRDFNDLLERYKASVGEEKLAESLWQLESRDLEYRINQLAFEIGCAELDSLGIDGVAQYVGEEGDKMIADCEEIKYYVKFREGVVCQNPAKKTFLQR